MGKFTNYLDMPDLIVSLLYNSVRIGAFPHSLIGCYVPINLKNF